MHPYGLRALIKTNDSPNLHLLDTDVSINNSGLQAQHWETNNHLYSRFKTRSDSLAGSQLRDSDAHADMLSSCLKQIKSTHLIPSSFQTWWKWVSPHLLQQWVGSQTFGHWGRVHIPPVGRVCMCACACVCALVCVNARSEKMPRQLNTGGHSQGSNFWHEAEAENS